MSDVEKHAHDVTAPGDALQGGVAGDTTSPPAEVGHTPGTTHDLDALRYKYAWTGHPAFQPQSSVDVLALIERVREAESATAHAILWAERHQTACEAAIKERDDLTMRLAASEHNRQADNAHLIRERDELRAEVARLRYVLYGVQGEPVLG